MTAVSTEWAIAMFLRGSMLLAAALVASWMFGRRWPSGVSAWHRAMLVGLLVLPCGVAFMPRLTLAWLPASATERIGQTAPASPIAIGPSKDLIARRPAGEKKIRPESTEGGASRTSEPIASANALPPADFHQDIEIPEAGQGVSWTSVLAVGIAAIYVMGVVLGLIRFAQGFQQAARLRRDTTPAEPAWQAASAHWSGILGIRREVPVVVTDRLPVPATLGWLHPLILIPNRMETNKCNENCSRHTPCAVGDSRHTECAGYVNAVLLHELAHVARRDASWQGLARLVGAIYWCHPLMWLVSREVEAAWDAACDSVCAFHLGVGSYSRSLADLAQSLVGRRLTRVGLCMARSSRLAGRIRRLKDVPNDGECRPRRSKRAAIWAMGLACAILAAVVTPVERSAVADTPTEGDSPIFVDHRCATVPAKIGTVPFADAPKTPSVVSGTVLDEDGSPLPDAKLFIRALDYKRLQDPHHQTCFISAKLREWRLVTGRDGSFRFEPGDPPSPGQLGVKVTITARGRLEFLQNFNWEDLAKGKFARFRLARGHLVAGRILAPNGQPVEGASIRASSTYQRRFDWESENGMLDVDRKTRWLSYWADAVKSDGKGRFEVTLPVKTYAELCVAAPDWAPQRVVVQANAAQVGDVKLMKGWRLSGKLLNRQGKPVAGQIVRIDSRDGGHVPNQCVLLSRYDKTDSEGCFKLLPARGVFSVSLMPACWDDTGADDPQLRADGPLVLLTPTVVQLDGSDPTPKIILQEPEAVKLSGRVTYEDGRPAEGICFDAFAECPSVSGETKSSSGTYYELAAGSSDKEGRYSLTVPRNISPHISAAGWGANNKLYWPWPQQTPNAVQLNMGSMALKNVTEDVGNLDWVLKPDKERASSPTPDAKEPMTPQPGDEAIEQLIGEIKAVHKRGEDPRLTMLDRCFEVEKQNRGSRAAIGALHFVMHAASIPAQSIDDARDRAARLLRDHYLDHCDLDLLLDYFANGYGGSAECEALLKSAHKNSPHPYVRAAAGIYLAEMLQLRTRLYHMFHDFDISAHYAGMDAKYREQIAAQYRDQFAKIEKRWGGFDEKANESAIVSLLDDVIEHYASVKTPNCRWDYPNYPDCEIRFTRPVPDEQIAFQPDWHDYAARAAWRKFQVTQLKLGQPAPDIVGNDVQGKPAKLSDDRGRVVVLTVGYSFGEGDAAVKKCIELRKKHGNAPLAMVSVVEERPDEPYYAYNNAAGAGITWKVIADPHGVLCAHWCQETFPEVYVIDAAGILRFHGISGPYSEDFTPLVEDLLKEAESTKKP